MTDVIRVSVLPCPVPLEFVYVGNGNVTDGIHPSPWLNPLSSRSASAAQARLLFMDYAMGRADAREWLAPLFGATLISEEGQAGEHALALVDLISTLSGGVHEEGVRKREEISPHPFLHSQILDQTVDAYPSEHRANTDDLEMDDGCVTRRAAGESQVPGGAVSTLGAGRAR